MTNYLKDGAKNEAIPEFIDFELLVSNLSKLLNNEECQVPIYDFKTGKELMKLKK